MRGELFHNKIVHDTADIFSRNKWHVLLEYRYQNDLVTTYFDLFAVKNGRQIACEIETTTRHLLDNARKASLAGIELWIIVPSRKLLRQADKQLAASGIRNTLSICLLLANQAELTLTILERKETSCTLDGAEF